MKRTRLIVAGLVIAAIAAMTVFITIKISKATKEYQTRLSLPEFVFQDLGGNDLTNKSLGLPKPLMLMLFDPDCGKCQEELADIKNSLPAFEGVEVVLVSTADITRVKEITHQMALDSVPNVHIALTTPEYFEKTFGAIRTPSTFFYGVDGTLKEDFYGKVTPQGLQQGLSKIKP